MGKHIKTSMDEKVIAYLAIEVYRLDPDNETLNKFRSMLTDTGYEIDKVLKEYEKTKAYPTHYNTDGTWKNKSSQGVVWPWHAVWS